jgi:vanillate O-demethylase ferredoxin subunit
MTQAAARRRQPFNRRTAFLPIHRWIGLTLGLIVLTSALTGAGMAFRKELDPLVYPDLLKAPPCAPHLPLDVFVAQAKALHPEGELDFIRLQDRLDAPVSLRFADKDTYYFNGCTGALMGRQNRYEGLFGRLEQIHRFVFIENGGWIMGAGAAALALALIPLGLTVWWPRPPQRLANALAPNTNLRGRAFELSLHRSLGAWAAIPLLVSALTAQPQAFDAVRHAIDALAGTAVEKPPKSSPPAVATARPKKIAMEQAWQAAQALSPHPREALLHLAAKPRSPIEIFLIAPDAPHANARTYLYLDAYSGRVLRFTPYARMGLGEKIYFWTLSIHTGQVGGVAGQALLFAGAFSVPVLAYTGIGSWLRRQAEQRRRKASPKAARA